MWARALAAWDSEGACNRSEGRVFFTTGVTEGQTRSEKGWFYAGSETALALGDRTINRLRFITEFHLLPIPLRYRQVQPIKHPLYLPACLPVAQASSLPAKKERKKERERERGLKVQSYLPTPLIPQS